MVILSNYVFSFLWGLKESIYNLDSFLFKLVYFFTGSIIVFGYTDVIWIRFEENSYEYECISKLMGYINPKTPDLPIFSIWFVLSLRSFCYQTYIILVCIGMSNLGVPPYVPSPFRGLLILLKLIFGG